MAFAIKAIGGKHAKLLAEVMKEAKGTGNTLRALLLLQLLMQEAYLPRGTRRA